MLLSSLLCLSLHYSIFECLDCLVHFFSLPHPILQYLTDSSVIFRRTPPRQASGISRTSGTSRTSQRTPPRSSPRTCPRTCPRTSQEVWELPKTCPKTYPKTYPKTFPKTYPKTSRIFSHGGFAIKMLRPKKSGKPRGATLRNSSRGKFGGLSEEIREVFGEVFG